MINDQWHRILNDLRTDKKNITQTLHIAFNLHPSHCPATHRYCCRQSLHNAILTQIE